jgi:hypothetical protein
VLPAASLQRIRKEIARARPAIELNRSDGAALIACYLDRFDCPLGAVWMISIPVLGRDEITLTGDEPLTGFVRVGQRVLRFSSRVVVAQAALERNAETEGRVCLLAEPEDFAEVQRRGWHRARARHQLISEATLYFEGSRVIAGSEYEVRRGMERTSVQVLDISGGGVSFEADARLAHELQLDETVRLTIEVAGESEPFGFSAQIRNRRVTDSKVRYGVAFHGDDRLFGEISGRALHLVFLLQTEDGAE